MTFGEKLRALRLRAGVSIRAAAADAGMKTASNWQHYESPQFQGTTLPADYTVRIASVWPGKGSPAITLADVLDLSPELATFMSGRGSTFASTVKHVGDEVVVKIDIQTMSLEAFVKLTELFAETIAQSKEQSINKD